VTPTLHLYLDDSGSRDLDRTQSQIGSDWFALGGLLIREEDEALARLSHTKFCQYWRISYPLHSYEIRKRTGHFEWISGLPQQQRQQIFGELTEVLINLPVLGTACVIDRQGYNDRYRAKYGHRRWALCKTAFSIVVERAAKYARQQGCRLKVFYERSDKQNEARIDGYFAAMRTLGMPFDQTNSEPYGPLNSVQMRETLWECRKKYKSSPVMQFADLYLFPLCIGGYDQTDRALVTLRNHARIIDCVLPPEHQRDIGVKYSCFDFEHKKGKDMSFP